MNQNKRFFTLILLLIFTIVAVACGQEAAYNISNQPITVNQTKQLASFHIGIATIGYAQAEDEMRGAEALVADFGDAKYGGMVKHIVLPDDFAQEQETIIKDITGLANDPLMKAIIVNPAVGGTAEAFRLIKEKRDDILLIAAGPQDDPNLITSVADIVVDQDFISRGYYDIVRAKQMGATTFVHMSFPRHMAIDQIFRRREIFESVCNDLGIQFVYVTTPDPAGEIGVLGSQQAVYDMIPQLVEKYGKDTVFFTTNTAQHEPIIKRVIEYGALFVTTDDVSPLVGYPAALNLDLREEARDWKKIVNKIEQAVVEKGMNGRMGIFAYSLTYCHSRALGHIAVDILEGNGTGDLMVDVANAYKALTPGCEWKAGRYRIANTSKEIDNFYTLSQDTYILGQGYSGVMNESASPNYTLVYLAICVLSLLVLASILYFKRRSPTPTSSTASTSSSESSASSESSTSSLSSPVQLVEVELPPSTDLGKFKLTARELEILKLLASGHSTAQIAKDLFISEKTVRVHISNMIAKTNSASRVDLILLAKQELSTNPDETPIS